LYKFLLILNVLFFPGACASFEPPPFLEEGIDYETTSYKDQKIHLLTIQGHPIRLVKASGLEKPSRLASQSLAAINGGFFQSDGRPAGAFRLNGSWIQKPIKNRGVFGLKNRGGTSEYYFDRLLGLQEAGISKTVSSLPQSPGNWWDEGNFVVGGAPLLIYNGEALDFESEHLLQSFVERPYGRTAVCQTKDHQLMFVVVEGGDRLSWRLGFRSGLNLFDLRDFLLSIGCHHALNLDGGRSSCMVLRGKKINAGSFLSGERPVSDVLMVD
jgi:exopolysaccharide biosynthesis protein